MFGHGLIFFISLFVFIFNVLLVARVLMSYFADSSNRLFAALVGITEPILGPVRNLLPKAYGADLAPLVVFIILEIIQRVALHFIPTP